MAKKKVKKNKQKLKKAPKVLFVATVDTHILQFHLPYLKMFKDNGYEVHVATNGDAEIPYCDKKHVVPMERSPFKLNNLRAIKQLKKIIDKEKFKIIHCHTPMGSVVTRIAAMKARKNGTRVIYTAHGFHFYKGASIKNWLVYYPVEKFLSRYTDTLITINEEDYELAKKKFHAKQIELVHGVGVDPEKFNFEMSEEEKDKLRQEVGVNKEDFVMICVGELNDNKNQIMQIEAMRELVKEKQNIKLLLAGEGDKREFLEQKIKEYNLENNVKLLGYRTDISKLLNISNLALSTSKREGLPVNVIEALMSGIPVIGTDCRGTRDLIQDGVNGYVVDIYNHVQLQGAIKKVDHLGEKRKELKEKSKLFVEKYMLKNTLVKLNDIYLKKKRVLHILSSNSYSGAENVVCTIIDNLREEYDMYYCCPEGKIVNMLQEKNIQYENIKKISVNEIKKIVNRINPDIIHAHDNKATVFASRFGKHYKVISHIHGNNKIMSTINLKTILFNYCTKNIHKIIWVSDSSFDDYIFKNRVIEKSIVLYNVIDKKEIEKKSLLYDCKKEFDMIYLGRLAYPKNPKRLIEIIKLLKSKNKDIQLAIVGDGVEREEIEKSIIKYDLSNNIKMYGFQANPYPILKMSKVLIMTSLYEGTPMCALEAQALNKPIVATPVDGLKKIVVNWKNGFLSNDSDELVESINEILNYDKLENKKMNDYIEQSFNKNNNMQKYKKTIRRIYE